jgi:ParB/RepB/Spo0J family partition protein
MKPVETHQTYLLPTAEIYADEAFNCRGKIQLPLLVDLANSIRDQGLHIPVIVWEQDNLPNNCRYSLVAGFRRFFASTKLLQKPEILATIRTDLTEETARRLNFTENLERKDLNILEEARAIAISFPIGTPIKAIARALHRSQEWTSVRVHLAQLSDEVQEYAAQGLLKVEDIQLLYSLKPVARTTVLCSIVKARRAGKIPVPFDRRKLPTGKRQLLHRPGNKELQEILQQLIERGFNGLVAKLVLFAMGRESAEKIVSLIERADWHMQCYRKKQRHDHKAEAVLYNLSGPCEKNTCIPSPKNLQS